MSLGGAQKAQAETTPTLGEKSAYTIKTGTETDYTYKTTDFDGVNSYHKIELKTPLSSSDSITWTEATSAGENTVSVQLPHNDDSANPEIKYYTYSYTKPSDYTTATNRVTDISTAGAVNRVLFQGISSSSNGGAIYNTADNSSINITADFIDNYTQGYYSAYGGAIYNQYATIGNITGDFIDNYAQSTSSSVNGGAIYNEGTIGNITGDFIGNFAQSIEARGGAINNQAGTIGNITGDFIGNYASSTSYSSVGGAIDNIGTIGNITGDFIGNYASSTSSGASGGAISNHSGVSLTNKQFGNITGDFIGNYVQGSYAYGGAIYNNSFATGHLQLGDITGDFIGNYAQGSSIVYGGAIYNNGTIGNIEGDFVGNYVQTTSGTADGGAIYNGDTIGDITGNFINNKATHSGGAIINALGHIEGSAFITMNIKGYIKSITGNFVNNQSNNFGGAICNIYSSNIGRITGDFVNNNSALGGAIYNDGIIGVINNGQILGGIENSSFVGNYAKSEDCTAQGGAIWTNTDLNIIAKDGYISMFEGNYTESNGIKDNNAIYVDIATLNFEMLNGGHFVFKDNIRANSVSPESFYAANGVANLNEYAKLQGFDDYYTDTFLSQNGYSSLNEWATAWGFENEEAMLSAYGYDSIEEMAVAWGFIEGTPGEQFLHSRRYASEEEFLKSQGVGESYINIKGDDINNTTFYLLNDIHNANVSFANTTINTINNNVHTYNFNKLTLNDNTNFVADVDLEAQTMDRFTADSYGQHAGNLNVVGMNLLTDAPEDREVTEIYFAQQGLKDNVAYGGAELPHDNYQTTFYTPIYKYNAIYDNRDDAGYFMFTKGDKIISGGGTSTPIITPSGNPSDAFNPAVLGSSTSATVGAIGTMNTTMHYAFQNAENYMHIPYLERISHRDRNKYALSPTGDATDMGTFSPLFNKKDYGSAWVKPYATFENVALKNGPKVSNITYGTLIGFDTDIESIKRGWDRTFTGYIAYNGASQRYSGVDSYQNGGLIGGTMTLYKGNFFNATTVSVGANVASNSTMYGNDNYTMLLGGIGNKAGYNFEIKEGKLIFQPSMLVSYTWVNTFDYTNAAGVKIENDPLHAIQLAPGVKLIGNTKNGWQPYIGVNMVWNLMGKSDATANGVRLPAMSIKPYVQYGVGVQKRFKDHFMGFGQVMVHSGGRNGVSINGGFRWALGHDCNCQKVEGKGLFKFARKNKEVEAQPYDMMYRGNQQFGLYNRKVIKQLASVERVKAMK